MTSRIIAAKVAAMEGDHVNAGGNGGGRSPDIDTLASGIRAGERKTLARAVTLVESSKPADREAAERLIERLLPETGGAVRVGLSGVPGAGKSTLIDALGSHLVGEGRKVAVLAVDPSSGRSGGSILGDKTRMGRLAAEENAFIRPSPSAGRLGGVARATRESLLLCEAAGFDVVIVETIGAGQAEYAVADMVDVFVLLLLAGGGDQLQGIKKGALEIADILAVNKADADRAAARHALRDYNAALRIVIDPESPWRPPVLTLSASHGEGVEELWRTVREHEECMRQAGLLESRRQQQRLKWMWSTLEDRLMEDFRAAEGVKAEIARVSAAVESGDMGAGAGARVLLESYRKG